MKQIKEVRFYLEVDLYEKIVKLAEKDNRSVENMVETVLKRWVEKEENMREFRANYPLTPMDSYPVRSPIYRTPPGTSSVSPPNTCGGTSVGSTGETIKVSDSGPIGPVGCCGGPTSSPMWEFNGSNGEEVGPNGAMFASTDNPNGTCVTNGEEVGIK